MMALLRNRKTGLYWGGEGKWLEEPGGAFHFPTIPEAVRTASEFLDDELDLALKFEEPNCEIDLEVAVCRRAVQPGKNGTKGISSKSQVPNYFAETL